VALLSKLSSLSADLVSLSQILLFFLLCQ